MMIMMMISHVAWNEMGGWSWNRAWTWKYWWNPDH